ncbi:MAG: glycosyltransferase [candidate division Zixibacteria bacterium]|jgi:glycosyltransferase involved in cell wall biosynthesis|nr:glycosyltransferase [candidate division Zixibacteria bacterium]
MARRIVIFGWAESVHASRWVKALHQRGHAVKLVSLGGEPKDYCETINFPRRGYLDYLRYAPAAAREAIRFKPDLVHVHYAAGFGLWGLWTRFKPTVVSVWGSDIQKIARHPLYRPLVRAMLMRAAAVTATSEFLKRQTAALFRPSEKKCEVIPFGVNLPDSVLPMPPERPFRLCYLKLHSKIYGPDVLLNALAKARESVPDIELSMAGSGEMTESLKRQAKKLGLEGAVNFPGFLDNADVPAFLARHHALVMPSLTESFGVAALEAGACGRPTVGSDVGGIPEVVRHDQTGLLVPPGEEGPLADAIIRLAGDPSLTRRLGANARCLTEREFDWRKSLEMMETLYERLLMSNEV